MSGGFPGAPIDDEMIDWPNKDSFDAAGSSTENFQGIQYTMGDHSIDVAGISRGDSSSKPCIFEVPDILRKHSPESFTPNLFSIGPLHYQKEYLKAQIKVKKIKQHYLANLLSRKPTPHRTLEDFKRSILEVEEKARQCYDVPFVHISKDKFVDMLILDGCFIIEFLLIFSAHMHIDDDPVLSVGWVLQVLYHDLILLENQIPWFVLEHLFEMTTEKKSHSEPLTKLALDFLGGKFSRESLCLNIEGSDKSNHMLDLLRKSLVSSFGAGQELTKKGSDKSNHILDLLKKPLVSLFGAKQGSTLDWQLIPTATSLQERGIRFKTNQSSTLLDITFHEGVLKIPSLIIYKTTCQTLRNLISYEQCYPNCEPKITSYAILLNNLIYTTKDIEVLQKAGIVENWLNIIDTLQFFNSIDMDTYVKKCYYTKIYEDVNEYTDRFWPRARAAYVRTFWDPIGSLQLFAAAAALILTFVQTFYTILQYIESSNPTSTPPPPPPS